MQVIDLGLFLINVLTHDNQSEKKKIFELSDNKKIPSVFLNYAWYI